MITALRGTADILPPGTALWQHVERAARVLFERSGFAEIRTPMFEMTELFVRTVGDTTDIVEKEMYTFADKKGRSLTLRPEGTACVVRACIEHKLLAQSKLLKLWYMGPMFRYERPQAGRQRQFNQIGLELFGTYSPLADAEAIALLVRYFESLGLNGLTVKINSLGDAQSRATYRDRLAAYAAPHKEALCPDCRRRMERNVLRLLDCKVEGCRTVMNAPERPAMIDTLDEASRARYHAVCAQLSRLEISYVEEPRLVRGLDYYRDTIFEVAHSALGAQDALGGGGRYDGLVHSMGGPETGAVGWALGVERLVIALTQLNQAVAAQPPVFLAAFDEQAVADNLVLADTLRTAGIAAVAGYDKQSLKAQMREANASGARWVLISGPDERLQGIVKLKDMADGTETAVAVDAVVGEMKKRNA
ncbi:histidine--tRNA ligase [bacterium]|nr:histidine--tRNA ligase [bacterium]